MRNNEYDNFGPWIQEIKDLEDIPRLFTPYFSKTDDVLLLLKIPRNIDRINANPGMDLYDYVIGVYDGHLSILKRNSNSVEVIEIKLRDIIAIKESIELLNGTITLYLPEKIISFNYNSVSTDLIQQLLRLIRVQSIGNVNFINDEKADYNNIEGIDDLYKILIKSFAKGNDQFKVLAIQPSIKVIPKCVSVLKRVIDFLIVSREKLLQNSMYLTNEKELLIVTRGNVFRKRKIARYGYDFTYIPLAKITNFEDSFISNYKNISPFCIKTQHHTFQYYFENRNVQRKNLSRICEYGSV
jgi:hypothetical protein